ncbi:MAG: PTS fructose transporter subunit IIA, partial [Pseudomonadota bacterium]
SVMPKGDIEVIAGVNLPMLIKLAEVRSAMSLADAAQAASDAGKKYISIASQLLEKRA